MYYNNYIQQPLCRKLIQIINTITLKMVGICRDYRVNRGLGLYGSELSKSVIGFL